MEIKDLIQAIRSGDTASAKTAVVEMLNTKRDQLVADATAFIRGSMFEGTEDKDPEGKDPVDPDNKDPENKDPDNKDPKDPDPKDPENKD